MPSPLTTKPDLSTQPDLSGALVVRSCGGAKLDAGVGQQHAGGFPGRASHRRIVAHQVLRDATLPELPNHYRGKVRDNYDLPDGRRILITSDRISAFDRALAQVLKETKRGFWSGLGARSKMYGHLLTFWVRKRRGE